MLKIMMNTFKLLFKKKSFIIMGVVAPAIIIVFFSFIFGQDINYKVGIINKDNNYISKEIVEAIAKIDNVDVVDIKNDNYEMLLVSNEIELAIIIEDSFSEDILNLREDKVIIKSISNSDVKAILMNIVKNKINNVSLIAKVSDKNLDKFIEINEEYKKNIANYSLSKVSENRPSIGNSIGIVIMMILINGASIANFLIEDEEQDTKTRVLVSGISQYKYYLALLIVFYLLSSITSVIYFILCKALRLDFGMSNTNNFLIIMLLLNLVAISLNLFIISFTRNRYVASTVNVLIVIPSCMVSGVFWDFNIMPTYLQRIGNYMPQRSVYMAIERMQAYSSLSYIKEHIFYMLLISFMLFLLSLFIFNIRKTINP